MDIVAAGNSMALTWVIQRLESKGHTVTKDKKLTQSLLKHSEGTAWSCLLIGNCLVSLGDVDMAYLAWCKSQPALRDMQHAELLSPWHEAGIALGFILFVGASSHIHTALLPLLNDLAPLPGAWLYCGPVGGAAFVSRIFNTLIYTKGPTQQAGWPIPAAIASLPNWAAFFAQQHSLATHLLLLSKAYLANHPKIEPVKAKQLLEEFTLPPAQQIHYAYNLANLLVLTLEHSPVLLADTKLFAKP